MADLHSRQEADLDLRLIAHVVTTMRGKPPAGYWYAPGVATLIGDSTTGISIPTQWGAVVAGDTNAERVLDIRSINRPSEGLRIELDSAATDAAGNVQLSVVRQMIASGYRLSGTDLLGWTDVPIGVGAGTEVGLRCATAMAIRDLTASGLTDEQLIAILDTANHGHYATALLTQPGHALAHSGAAELRNLPFDPAAHDLRILIIDTRIRVPATARPDETEMLAPTAELLASQDFSGLGAMLIAAHEQARQAGLTDERQDIAVGAAVAGGALGARAVHDWEGRPVIAIAPLRALGRIRSELLNAFAAHGWRAPRMLTAASSRPAHRVG